MMFYTNPRIICPTPVFGAQPWELNLWLARWPSVKEFEMAAPVGTMFRAPGIFFSAGGISLCDVARAFPNLKSFCIPEAFVPFG